MLTDILFRLHCPLPCPWTPPPPSNNVYLATVVISSTGGANQRRGGELGQYEYLEDKGYYVQSSTGQKHISRYLYHDADDKWWVSSAPGEERGWLRNPIPSKTLPASGWQYLDGTSHKDDPTLTISPGPLPLVRQFTVTATGAAAAKFPSYLGVFTRTKRWWRGRPVYTNTHGRFLFHGPGGFGWEIGYAVGGSYLSGSRAHHSPVSQENWRYLSESEWKPASVRVTASD